MARTEKISVYVSPETRRDLDAYRKRLTVTVSESSVIDKALQTFLAREEVRADYGTPRAARP